MLSLSKLADIPIELHRPLPDDATVKEVTLKKEKTGEWFAVFGVEMDTEPPAKPSLDEIDAENMVGIDAGILKHAHDTDGTAVESLDLSNERDRLEREQRTLSCKEYEFNNWEKQRQRVAECHRRIKRKRRDFLHELPNYYAREYELVAVEDLDTKELLESPGNSRNTASAAWNTFTSILETKGKREATHFVEVNPAGTTRECACCGVETDKPLWVREHSCPACGFKADRDANAVVRLRLTGSKREAFATAWNILSRGLAKLGVGHSKDTPVETALPAGTAVFLQSASWKQEASGLAPEALHSRCTIARSQSTSWIRSNVGVERKRETVLRSVLAPITAKS